MRTLLFPSEREQELLDTAKPKSQPFEGGSLFLSLTKLLQHFLPLDGGGKVGVPPPLAPPTKGGEIVDTL